MKITIPFPCEDDVPWFCCEWQPKKIGFLHALVSVGAAFGAAFGYVERLPLSLDTIRWFLCFWVNW